MQYFYLLALLVSLAGLSVVDWRFNLNIVSSKAFRYALAACLGFFLFWDLVGVHLDIFFTDPDKVASINPFASSIPLEEILFISLLTLVTAVLSKWQEKS